MLTVLVVFDEPLHSSVFAKIGGSCVPPIFIAEVFVPDPKLDFVEVFKLFTSVQFVPFHCSVAPVLGGPPPKSIILVEGAEFEEPQLYRPVFKSLTSVQFVPFQVSVNALRVSPGGGAP